MELRGQPRGCHQVRRRGLRAPQELHPNLSAEATRAPPTMAGGRAAAAPAGPGRPAAHDADVTVIHHRLASRAVLCIIRIILYFILIRIMYWRTLRAAAGARARHWDPRSQTLPAPRPIVAALAHAPDRSHRRPGAVLHCRTLETS